MSSRMAYVLLTLTVASFTGSACAMTDSARRLIDCQVVGGEKLPAALGGGDALCAAIVRAGAVNAPGQRFKVAVTVRGESSLSAILTTAAGEVLPEQHFRISDRGLTKGSLDRFAKTITSEVARAASR